MKNKSRGKIQLILTELRMHLPFTLLGVATAFFAVFAAHALIKRFSNQDPVEIFEVIFHSAHSGHVFLSAMTSGAVFFHHEHRLWKAIPVGLVTSLLPCGLSDILFPFLGGKLLGAPMEFHLCLIQEPVMIFAAAGTGLAAGLFLEEKLGRISFLSHGAHVFTSCFATLFYLVSFGVDHWLQMAGALFAVTVISVVIPCCSSDIVMPLSLISGLHGHEHLDEHTCPEGPHHHH